MPPTLGASRLGVRRTWWSRIFGGADVPDGGSRVGSVRVAPDDPAQPQRYTGTLMARAPLRELGPVDVGTVDELRGNRRVAEVRFGLGVARSNRRADALQQILDDARAARSPRETAASASTEATRFSRAFHWSLSIPGTHYSGLTNDALLEILAAQGRPFASDTPQLRDHVRDRLVAAFGAAVWEPERAVDVTARAVREWIVRRIEQQGLDVKLDELDDDYRDAKVAHGFDRRIGIKTGAWLGSVKNATVEIAAA